MHTHGSFFLTLLGPSCSQARDEALQASSASPRLPRTYKTSASTWPYLPCSLVLGGGIHPLSLHLLEGSTAGTSPAAWGCQGG